MRHCSQLSSLCLFHGPQQPPHPYQQASGFPVLLPTVTTNKVELILEPTMHTHIQPRPKSNILLCLWDMSKNEVRNPRVHHESCLFTVLSSYHAYILAPMDKSEKSQGTKLKKITQSRTVFEQKYSNVSFVYMDKKQMKLCLFMVSASHLGQGQSPFLNQTKPFVSDPWTIVLHSDTFEVHQLFHTPEGLAGQHELMYVSCSHHSDGAGLSPS